MSKRKNKQGSAIFQIISAYTKPSEEANASQEPKRGTKRARDGSPIDEPSNKTVKKAVRPTSVPKELEIRRENPSVEEETSQTSQPKKIPSITTARKNPAANGIRPNIQSAPPPSDQSNHSSSRLPNGKAHVQPQNGLSRKREALLSTKKGLPIWPHAEGIRAALRRNNVLVLTGETGSGKSTQVPQFLLSEPWCSKCIAITQPRRVAAISLARRVAEEMGTFMGTGKAAKVGYSVRFDNATGPNTRIKFLTEGMLLQEFLRDPEMEQYSAIIVDEVHERSVNVDLILGFLRNLVADLERGKAKKRKQPLKVVIMSATADVEGLVKFFDDGLKEETANGEAGGEAVEETNSVTPGAKKDKKMAKRSASDDTQPQQDNRISTCFVEGRQYPVKMVYLPEPTDDWVESALKLIFRIHYKEPLPGDILVFLPGQDTIEGLEKLVKDYAEGMEKDVPKLLALPLFAALPQHAQQLIFEPTPARTRKVILSTNIAETSVTVPGVRYVIDCGKSKIKQFRNNLGLESLLVKPISKSAAIQRKGRAGREAAGQCYRLYTEEAYNGLDERTTPEILRCDLSHAILTMKARGVDDVINFPFLDRPPREALRKALLQLLNLGALEETGVISERGLKMAKFPLTPTLGCVLVEAAHRDCLLEAIDIVSALSVENVFLNLTTDERKEEAETARRDLYRREGDHMTLLVTVQRYAEERTGRKAWCERHFVSHRAMQNVLNIRKQLRELCKSLKMLSYIPSDTPPAPSEERTKDILQCLLRGFIMNTARFMPDLSYRTFIGNQTVAIHPSSVLHKRQTEAIVFTEFVFTTKAFARGVSAVQYDWVDEVIEKVF
ncbi:P-loop containing nucleoside triphosphate hydrolase protein [Sporormia fimetaria CBS 119925]|uniref:RNA helicase n=1 Tax=Sporormia fimetaria CBS 119925 TaxID=1340428 RepID=A0A6A6VRA8_9PLEO|nr:P-loop containing nucleoside triphosphate hydrolase protein [Sporormia fimetaria CBS 119925]